MISVHLFDVDYTLIRKSTAYYFLQECLARHIFRFRHIGSLPLDMVGYKLGLIRGDFIEKAVARLVGIDRAELVAASVACFENRAKKCLYGGAVDLVTSLVAQKATVVLATSALDILLAPLERHLGITEKAICTRLEFAGGVTTGGIAGIVPFGAGKLAAVKAWCGEHGVPPADAAFYSDSYTDIGVLAFVGHPTVVNPDRFLAREAVKRGWPILRFA
jgi:HAD superfamily hydrolase (TIGR01490 family)